MANNEGMVAASVPGLADFAKITLEECEEGLRRLMMPDEYSRSPEHEGKRIAKVDGGWVLLNHGKYRAMMNADERRQYLTRKQQEYRQRLKMAKEEQRADLNQKRKKLGSISAELINGQPLKKHEEERKVEP